MYASLGGGGLVELAFAFSRKTDAVKLAVKIGAPSVGFARPYSHIGHLPVRSVERFDVDRAVRQFRSALAIRSFYEFPRDTQLGPGHPEKQRDHRGFHCCSPRSERENLAGGNDRSMARVYRRYRTHRRRVSGEGLSLFNAKPNLSSNGE